MQSRASSGVKGARRPVSALPVAQAGITDLPDRQVSSLISLGGVALILGHARQSLEQLPLFAPWWNVLGGALAALIVVFAALGWILPMRVLRAGWVAAPVLNAVLMLTSYGVYEGALPATASPWPWSFAAACLSYLTLIQRPAWAAAWTVLSALLPGLSALIFMGGIPQVLLIETPVQVANIIYIALFTGIRLRLIRLREARARALAAEAGLLLAQMRARDRKTLARLIHDEILSVLVSAMKLRGPVPEELRENASQALDLLRRPTLRLGDDQGAPVDTCAVGQRIADGLRRIDPPVPVDTRCEPGSVPLVVAVTVAAAAGEALRNSMSHAPGSRRSVSISVAPSRVSVRVRDSGHGFSPGHVDEARLGLRESVLARMRELPGGSAAVESAPGEGTEVTVQWAI